MYHLSNIYVFANHSQFGQVYVLSTRTKVGFLQEFNKILGSMHLLYVSTPQADMKGNFLVFVKLVYVYSKTTKTHYLVG